MRILFHCPACGKLTESQCGGSGGSVRCRNCAWKRTPRHDDFIDDIPHNCLVCRNADLWRQKDFSQRLGVAIVILGAILSSIAWWKHLPMTALGILMLFALADLVLFAVMPDVLVCYRCRARHRGVGGVSGHDAFDHEVAERYRQEQNRMRQAE